MLLQQINKKDDTLALADGLEAKKKTQKKIPPQIKGLKKNKKDDVKQEPLKSAEEEELERKKKE